MSKLLNMLAGVRSRTPESCNEALNFDDTNPPDLIMIYLFLVFTFAYLLLIFTYSLNHRFFVRIKFSRYW